MDSWGRFHHDGNPILSWCIANVTGKYMQGSDDIVRPVKEHPDKKIDGAVALLMAVNRALLAEEPQESIYNKAAVWDTYPKFCWLSVLHLFQGAVIWNLIQAFVCWLAAGTYPWLLFWWHLPGIDMFFNVDAKRKTSADRNQRGGLFFSTPVAGVKVDADTAVTYSAFRIVTGKHINSW